MASAFEVNGSSVKKYYSIASMAIAVEDGSGLKYLLTDQLGSVVAITNIDRTLASQHGYMLFGQVRKINGSQITLQVRGTTVT